MLSRVDLPAPLAPMMARNSPGLTVPQANTHISVSLYLEPMSILSFLLLFFSRYVFIFNKNEYKKIN